MIKRCSSTVLSAAIFFIFSFGVMPVSALTLRATTWRELRACSDWVVCGIVSSMKSEVCTEPGSGGVQTRLKLDAVEHLVGKKSDSEFSVLLPGGAIGERKVNIPGAPKFSIGERVVLMLRAIGENEFALCGYGMGVFRVSADSVKPDIPVSGGVPRTGETFQDFVARLNGLSAAPATADHKQFPFLIIAVLLAVIIGISLRSRWRGKIVLIAFFAGLASAFFIGSKTNAVSVGSREFVLEGSRWFLDHERPGQLEGGRVLWFQGQGSTHQPDADAFAVIASQFQQWEDISTSAIAFRKAGLSANSGTAVDVRSVVSFLAKPPRAAFDKFTLAITFIESFNSQEIADADIVFNDRDVDWVLNQGPLSIAAVSLHEIGHFLGLDHTADPSTVMFPTSQGLTVLSPGDIAGATFIYPVDSSPPIAVASASPQTGIVPFDVAFSSDGSQLANGSTPNFLWDFGDGSPADTTPNPVHTYSAAGVYTAKLLVSDANGNSNSALVTIVALTANGTFTVQKLSFTSGFAQSRSGRANDKLSMSMSGVEFSPGDRLLIQFGNLGLDAASGSGADTQSVELDDTLSFVGVSNFGGILTVRVDPKTHFLSLSLTRAQLGRFIDPRAPDNLAQSGTINMPSLLIVERKGGGVELFSTDVAVTFTIKSGRTAFGIVEKSIQGKH